MAIDGLRSHAAVCPEVDVGAAHADILNPDDGVVWVVYRWDGEVLDFGASCAVEEDGGILAD